MLKRKPRGEASKHASKFYFRVEENEPKKRLDLFDAKIQKVQGWDNTRVNFLRIW